MFRFILLGAPAVLRAGTPPTPMPQMPPQQAAVLAALALRAGTSVGTDELVDGLFGERPPASAVSMVANYVLRLRKGLGRGLIVRSGGGYALDVPRSAVDALEFADLAAARLTGDDLADADRLGTALGLWGGRTALAGLPGPLCHGRRESLGQQREAVLLSWYECELALGNHGSLLAQISASCQAAPFAEDLHAAWMTTLYRCGMRAEALHVYRRMRRRLAEDLGIDPGAHLSAVHHAILDGQDPATAERTVRSAAGPYPRSAPRPGQSTASLEDWWPDRAAQAGPRCARSSAQLEPRADPSTMPTAFSYIVWM